MTAECITRLDTASAGSGLPSSRAVKKQLCATPQGMAGKGWSLGDLTELSTKSKRRATEFIRRHMWELLSA